MPIIANFMQNFPPSVEISIENINVTLEIGLPFNWKALYFSALMISLAKGLHFLLSPEFIRQYQDYEDFKVSGRGGGYLQKTLYGLVPFWAKKTNNTLNDYVSNFDERIHFLNSSGIRSILQNEIWGASDQSFWLVYDVANYSKTYVRLICTIAIFIAVLLFSLVVIQKIYAVISII
jgi:hypothetical protein